MTEQVACGSRYIGDYDGQRCMSVVDGGARCVQLCAAVLSEKLIDGILDEARDAEGKVSLDKLQFMGDAAGEILGIFEQAPEAGGTDG